MKKMIIRACIFFNAILILSACIPEPKDVTNLPIPEERLVVANVSSPFFLSTETGLTFLITKSFSLLSYDANFTASDLTELAVTNLDMSLKNVKTQEERTFIRTEAGLYTLLNQNNFLEDYASYEIIIIDNDKRYTATSEVLPSVDFSKLSLTSEAQSNGKEVTPEIHFEFEDFPNKKNYYLVSARRGELTDLNLTEELLNYQGDFVVLDDSELFEGKIKTSFIIARRSVDILYEDNLLVGLSHITKDYYDYLTLYKKRSSGSSFLNEPFNVESNISGGVLGYFSLHATTIQTLQVPTKEEVAAQNKLKNQ